MVICCITPARSARPSRTPPPAGETRRRRSPRSRAAPGSSAAPRRWRGGAADRRGVRPTHGRRDRPSPAAAARGIPAAGSRLPPTDRRRSRRARRDRRWRGRGRLRPSTGLSSFSRSARISGRSVRPWITSEPSTTAKAVSRIRSRYGKSSGSANAAASVTMPRMPHHDTTMPPCTVGGVHRPADAPRRDEPQHACCKTSPRRSGSGSRSPSTAAAIRQYCSRSVSSSRSQIGCNCSPISTNASTLSTNTTVSHTA